MTSSISVAPSTPETSVPWARGGLPAVLSALASGARTDEVLALAAAALDALGGATTALFTPTGESGELAFRAGPGLESSARLRLANARAGEGQRPLPWVRGAAPERTVDDEPADEHLTGILGAWVRSCSVDPLRAPDGSLLGVLVGFRGAAANAPLRAVAEGYSALRDVLVVALTLEAAEASRRRALARTTPSRAELFNKNLLEVLGALVLQMDARGAIVAANRAIEDVLGFTPDEVVGKALFALIAAGEREAVMQFVADTLFGQGVDGRQPKVSVFSAQTKSGATKRLHLSATVVRDEDGEVLWILATGIDVTARERAFAALRASEERFRIVALQAQQIIYDYDVTTGRIHWLGAIADITGFSLDEFANVDVNAWMELIHPEDRSRAVSVLDECMLEGVDYHVAYRFRHKEGHYLAFEDRGTFVRSKEGSIVRMLGAMADVSERRRAEEALVQSQKLESLGLLAGGIAHDFNNLLTAMLCNVNLAQGSLGGADVASYLDSIEASIRQAATLTRQVLAYAGKGHLVMVALDLSSLVRDVVRAMGITVARTASLDVDLAEGLPLVEADAAQIQQVVLNLLTNAADSMAVEGGSIRISTRLVRVGEEDIQLMVPTVRVRAGFHVLLQVADTGCGMSAETQARIFDPFFTTKPKGHGLGLSALMGILRGHRAGIHLESEVGRGTLFRLYFPISERHDPRDRSSLPPARSMGRSRACVLVVDDDATIRDVLRPMLGAAGYTVLEAKDGEEGLQLYKQRNADIDVVLMDVTMPRKDGRDACVAMRQLRPDARVILMSGYAHHLDSKVLAATGAMAFLPKPFEMSELLRTVRAASSNVDEPPR